MPIASRTNPGQVAIVFVGKVRFRHDGDLGVPEPQEESEIERVIVAAIEKHARGDVEALARGIIEELRAAEIEPRGNAAYRMEYGTLIVVRSYPVKTIRLISMGWRRGWDLLPRR